jgi:hypothetical protein
MIQVQAAATRIAKKAVELDLVAGFVARNFLSIERMHLVFQS